jgi:glutamate synthase (NADPH/NADH) small chain
LAQFDSIFLGIGAQKAKALDISGEELEGVNQALPFLIQKNVPVCHSIRRKSKWRANAWRLLGGGDSAMDCLRTAIRCGASAATCILSA